MPRIASVAVIAGAFVAGLFLPDWVARVLPPLPAPSQVALEAGPEPEPERKETGPAPGGAMRKNADGTVQPESADVITPLNVRDPSALVFTPTRLQLPDCAEAPCDCTKDRLHRYTPKAPRHKELDALRGKAKRKAPAQSAK